MISLTHIQSPDNPLLEQVLPIYNEAFPPAERREEQQLKQVVSSIDNLYFNAIIFDGKPAGLFSYWDMGDFYFLEYFAVSAGMRNHKIGQQVLDWIADNLHGLRIMEVEPADTGELAARRIAYYQRNGYKVLDKSYHQPSFSAGYKGLPMWIMANHDTPKLSEYIGRIIAEVYTKPLPAVQK